MLFNIIILSSFFLKWIIIKTNSVGRYCLQFIKIILNIYDFLSTNIKSDGNKNKAFLLKKFGK